jgi:CHASE2 domain-containing sensor protein
VISLLVAHTGHWIPYVIPVAIVLVAVVVSSVRERRDRREGED